MKKKKKNSLTFESPEARLDLFLESMSAHLIKRVSKLIWAKSNAKIHKQEHKLN